MLTLDDLQKGTPKENAFERSLVKKIKTMFPDCYEVPKPVRPSGKGTPDRLFLIKGKFIALETKRAKNSRTAKIQLERVEEIRRAGGYAGIVKSLQEGLDILADAGLI